MRLLLALWLLVIGGVQADYLTTNQAVTEVSALYPGSVLSAEQLSSQEEVLVRLLSPAGLVYKLVVCKQGVTIKIKEISSENTGGRGSSCDTRSVKN